MTGKPPLSLTINNTAPARAKPPRPQVVSNADTAPGEAPTDRFNERLRARADLASVYASTLGVDALPHDILEAMTADGTEGGMTFQPQNLAHGMQAVGLETRVAQAAALTPDLWPAIAQMTSGQFVLVLSQSRGDLVIYDTTRPDNRTHIPLADFSPYFNGYLIHAEATMHRIEQAHTPKSAAPHWFWGQFDRFRRQFGEVALGSFVANLLAVSVALFSLQIYDRVIPHQSEATLWVLAAGAFIALLMEAFLKSARAQIMDGAGRQIEIGVQQMLMDRLLGMRSDLKGRSPSQLFASMREFSAVREFFTASTVGSLTDIPFIFLFLFLVASIAGNVVWVLVLGGVLMVLPGFFMQKRMMRLTQETQGASTKTSRLLHEVVTELDTVKTQRAEDRIRRLWSEMTALSSLKSSEQRRLSSMLTFWSQGVQQATYVSAVIMGTYLVFAGEFTIGSIIATGILTSRTLAPLTQLASTMARWSNVKSALDGLDGIADAPQDAEEARHYLRRETLKGVFELREVTFRYDDDGAQTLDLPALKIAPGQHLAVLGANGSGKSTFLKLLTGLYAPTKGSVMLDGTDIAQIEPRDLRRLIGYLGQDVRLFAGTLRDNLNLNMLERDDDRLMAALDFAGLGAFVRGHAKGLDLEIRDGGQGLSIGQRQSIGWARLWLQNPQICLLDEPTAALDQALETALVGRLGEWLKNRTAIIATHRVPILSLTDRTLVLNHGRMVVDGPREQVMMHLNGAQPMRKEA